MGTFRPVTPCCRWSTASCDAAPRAICAANGQITRCNRPPSSTRPTSDSPARIASTGRIGRTSSALAAQMMRRILVDHARERQAAKRPGSAIRLAFDEQIGAREQRDCEILLLEEALRELTLIDARQGQIVEFRYFAGMSEQEVAEVLSVSRSTVTREWQTARAWLYRRLTRKPKAGGR